MNNFLAKLKNSNNNNDNSVYSPCSGKVHILEDSTDPAFNDGSMGKGCYIVPESDYLYSPIDGTVLMVFPTKHALGLRSKDGTEMLIHIGIDTVELKGKYFEIEVNKGDKINAGDLIASVDFNAIKTLNYKTDLFVIVTNPKTIDLHINFKAIKHGDLLFTLTSEIKEVDGK